MHWEIGTTVNTNKGTVKVIGFDNNEALLQVIKDVDGNPVDNGAILRYPYVPSSEPSELPRRSTRRSYASHSQAAPAKKEPDETDLQIELAQLKEKLAVAKAKRESIVAKLATK
jgi:hypothetical protein